MRSNGNFSVAIACPGKRRTFQQSALLHSHGWLCKWITSAYFGANPLIENLPFIPTRVADVPNELIHSVILSELLFKGTSRFTFMSGIRPQIWSYRNQSFGRMASNVLKKLDYCDLYFGYGSGCGETGRFLIETAQTTGARVVLEQTSAPLDFEKSQLEKELNLWPESGHMKSMAMPQFLLDDEQFEHANADAIIVACNFIKDLLLQRGIPESRIHVLEKGIDTDYFSPAQSVQKHQESGPIQILYVGRVSLLKGVLHLLEAAKRIGGKYVHINIAGQVQLSLDFLRRYDNYVTFHGHVDKSRLRELYRSCDLYVHPSLSESVSLAVGEAMACGLPAIATRESGSFLRNGVDGFEIASGTHESIIEALSVFISDPSKIREFGVEAKAQASRYDIKDYGKRFCSTIESIANE